VLWLLFFFGLLDVYLLVSWIPTAMRVSGATPSVAIIAGIVLQAGAILASLTVGWSLDRFGPAGLAPAYVLGAICIAAIGHYAADIPIALIGAFGAGFGVVGSQAGLNAVATVSYPTALRATGVGWAVGIGRVGSIVGPVAGGALLNAHVPIESIFYMTAGPALILALASIAYARIHGRQLADSSDVS
jgi:AAHS family 4-hydroxybenzoate transporter-like MFS transporter